MRTSAYTRARLHPVQTVAALALLGAGMALSMRRREPETVGDLSDL